MIISRSFQGSLRNVPAYNLILYVDQQLAEKTNQIYFMQKFMDDYHCKIIELERRLLDDEDINMSLSLVYCEIEEYSRVFHVMIDIAEKIQQTGETGSTAHILATLNDVLVHCGDPLCYEILKKF